ncbi:hypothetical protein D3C72_1799580 [compost metagenome]
MVQHHLFGPGMHGVAVGDVDPGFGDLHAELAHQGGGFRQAFGIHVGQGHVAALAGEGAGQCAADAGAGTGDGGHLVLEGLHAGTSCAASCRAPWAAWAGTLRLKW